MQKRIKVAMLTNNLDVNGISNIVMGYCKELDKEKFDLNIIAGTPISSEYKKDGEKCGIHIIELPSRKKQSKQYYMALMKVLHKGWFDIVHIHGNSATISIELLIAWMCGVRIRIAHSHNTTCMNVNVHKLLYPLFVRMYTQGVACGKSAGSWLFRDRSFTVLPNGFYVEKFIFDKQKRNEIRDKLKLKEQDFIVGHGGRINKQKNQQYLLEIFRHIAANKQDAYLLLVGDGPELDMIKGIIENHPYSNRIIVYGETLEIEKVYAAMDVFVFPSLFEGLPVVLLEAQISGLACVVSDKVTKEIDFGDIYWKSLEENPLLWAKDILKMDLLTDEHREKYVERHYQQTSKYDIRKTQKQLESLYIGLYREIGYEEK